MLVIVALRFSLLRAPGTERFFRNEFCAKSAFPGAAVIRNDTVAPRREFWNSRRLVSTSFRPKQAKEDTVGEAQLFYLCRLARFRAIPGTLRTFTVMFRIFVTRFLRGCSVLRSLTPAVGFVSARRSCFRSRHFDS